MLELTLGEVVASLRELLCRAMYAQENRTFWCMDPTWGL